MTPSNVEALIIFLFYCLAMGVRVSVVRGVIVTPGKTDNRSGTRAIRIAVNAAIVRRSHGTAAPAAPTTMQAAPGGFGRNGW